ncbi:hypothetical protein LIT56_11215 [Flavobacterium psychrophilum]|uniref:hypothetical protein n=1 Tax=Flavobacterium psychrophilum TaxID=96345 RepID=UPI001D06A60C|nr:hypothetical protein [Flavobacterium psychrophilum]MCB5981559.1 hypothetical protein [Flavobacterium psychrophilum]MCB5989648.1 hypothetical protein [Flavobacterium psychrophilum]MCB6054993.1 hypothetical protein [Flavobacterium psychrophilum]MCB6057532.1 hypothetical protein [Flavobacterium psychrophilum]MCB6084363.1 hypothetical protein [Flavobacterium psychrophilum]
MITKLTFLILILILAIIFLYGLYKESELNTTTKQKVNKKANILGYFNILSLLLLIVLLPSYIWVFPNVIEFKSCNKIEKYILINPFKTYADLNFEFGNNISYVINDTDENLEILKLEYRYVDSSEEENNKQIISANSAEKIDISHFDFINEIIPHYIRTKSRKSTYYYIGCESSYDFNSIMIKKN